MSGKGPQPHEKPLAAKKHISSGVSAGFGRLSSCAHPDEDLQDLQDDGDNLILFSRPWGRWRFPATR